MKGPDVFMVTLHPVTLLAYCGALNMHVAAKKLKFYIVKPSHTSSLWQHRRSIQSKLPFWS